MIDFSRFFSLLGVLCILCAALLFGFNQQEARKAGTAAQAVLTQLETYAEPQEQPAIPIVLDPTMTEVEINGERYIGYLELPTLDLELPVISQWDYPRLQIAPCRYTGSTKTDDLVVMAHNYEKHFGFLRKLVLGDEVLFTDMDGVKTAYTVVAMETLMPAAVEDMTNGQYDLTLFTCTYGGSSRVTVRCDRMQDSSL